MADVRVCIYIENVGTYNETKFPCPSLRQAPARDPQVSAKSADRAKKITFG